MVRALAAAGATVVAVARDTDRLRTALHGTPARLVGCDITSQDWPDLLAGLTSEHGRLDILVNNAHVPRGGSLRTSTPSDFTEAMSLAVTATATGLVAASPGLEASARSGGPAAVVNVASMYGLVSPDPSLYDTEAGRNPPAYGAAKAALIQLTRYAAAEMGPLGVRVNSLVLGAFPGDPTATTTALHDRLGARTMLGRTGRPEEVMGPLLFLASHASSYVTGSTVTVDGGWTAW